MATTILTVDGLWKFYGAQEIFHDIRFQVLERDRIGLVGPNGAGKSTLLRILAGLESADAGQVTRQRGLRLVYVAQDPPMASGQTVFEATIQALAEVRAWGEKLEQLAKELAESRDPAEQAALLATYEQLSTRFEAAGGYELEVRARQVLFGLGFSEDQLAWPVEQLSGGQRTRLALAQALLSDSDLLLLDEPTNHLDSAALDWLEQFLQRWHGAVIVVAHDRYFLDRVTQRILELAFGRLEEYPGNYSQYLEERSRRFAQRRAAYEAQQAYIFKEEAFIQRYRAGQRAREARGRATKLARLERLERPQGFATWQLRLASSQSSEVVLQTTPLQIGYPNRPLFETPELVLPRGERIAIFGPNGAGKTTLLRTLLGEIPPLAGAIRFGRRVKPAYLPQDPQLNPQYTVLETVQQHSAFSDEQARSWCARFSFEGEEVFQPVATLSGGERRRLALALLSLQQPNLLLLDEPTNHLDLLSREGLEAVLAEFDGTILFVSHDRYFIDRLATRLWVIEASRLYEFFGNYTAYRQRTVTTPSVRPSPARTKLPEQPPTQQRSSRQIEREIRQLEQKIEQLEEQARALSEALEEAAAWQDIEALAELGHAYENLTQSIDTAYIRWEQLQEELAALHVER